MTPDGHDATTCLSHPNWLAASSQACAALAGASRSSRRVVGLPHRTDEILMATGPHSRLDHRQE
jgi:hypothetical protein